MTTGQSLHPQLSPEHAATGRRLEAAGWGLLLLLTGVLMLFPRDFLPDGIWLICAGAILLGISVLRFMSGLKASAFVVGLGVLAVAAGIAANYGVKFPLLAAFLILLGASITLRPWFSRGET